LYKNDLQVIRHIDMKSRQTGGIRSNIKKLSYKSRARMALTARNIPEMTYLITLTYPGHYIENDGIKVKEDWSILRKRLVRRGLHGIWWLEFQKRGAPHLHVAINGQVDEKWLGSAWSNIVNRNDWTGGKDVRIECKPFRSLHGAQAYMCKEAVKMAQKEVPAEYQNVGRFWGMFGGLKLQALHIVEKSVKDLKQKIRICRKWYEKNRPWNPADFKDNGNYGFIIVGGSKIFQHLLVPI